MWYVYDKQTTVIQKTVKTGPAARAWITRKQKEFIATRGLYVSNDGPLFDWSVAHSDNFHKNIEKSRTVRNLMTGDPVTISANTPRSCDPSSELYWVM
jgi:hypothetical protein